MVVLVLPVCQRRGVVCKRGEVVGSPCERPSLEWREERERTGITMSDGGLDVRFLLGF
jgi:hypothetical protein